MNNKTFLAVSIAAIFAASPVFSNDSGVYPEDDELYCETEYDPINCGREYFEGKPDIYLNSQDEGDCEQYAQDAIAKMFIENPKFASGVHHVGKKFAAHEITFVDRDYGADTKSSFGCALGLETEYKDNPRPYSLIRYSVSQTYVDGLVIYINDFKYVGAY